jgi:hypothetical protein
MRLLEETRKGTQNLQDQDQYPAMSGPPNLHDRPPEPNQNDHLIGKCHGTTMALDFLPSNLKAAKRMPRLSAEERLIEVLRQNIFLQQEIHFYRRCQEASLTMEDKVYEVSQQLMLAYYFEPEGTVELNQTAYRLSHDIYAAIDAYRAVMVEAEESWMAFWGFPNSRGLSRHPEFI